MPGDYTLTVRCEGIDTIWTGSADFTIARKPHRAARGGYDEVRLHRA